MSVAYYIVLEDEVDFDPFVNGKALAHQCEGVDALAARLALPPVDQWVSMSAEALADWLDDDAEDDPEDAADDGPAAEAPAVAQEGAEAETWFPAEAGLAYFEALAGHLRADPAAVPDGEAVLSDLEEYLAVLGQAQAAGVRWHLALDF